MSKKCMLMILLVCLAVMLAGCFPKLTEGTVIGKEYTPASVRIIPVVCGKIVVPVRREISEKWEILVSGHTDEGEEIREWWSVPQELFEQLNIGDYVKKEEQNEQ